MGNDLNKGIKERGILIAGSYTSGISTILEKLKQGEVVTTVSTTGLHGELLMFKNYHLDAFALGGRCSSRPMLQYYYKDTSALIFVVDSEERNAMQDVKYEFHLLLKEELLQDAVILVLANKQDLPEAVSIQELIQMLGLSDVKQEHCNIFGTCETTGEGLFEAFDWLRATLANKDQHTTPKVEQSQSSGKPENRDSSKGPKGYLKKLRARFKNVFVS